MKLYALGLLILLCLLQWQLWWGTNGLKTYRRLQAQIAEQQAHNAVLQKRNAELAAEVLDLQQGWAALEEHARQEFGMIKRGETFYWVLE